MKYTVTYTETLGKTLIIEADNAYEAKQKMLNAIESGDIELDATDYIEDSGNIEDCYESSDFELEFYPTIEDYLTD